jgi:hypothetical protein
MHWPHLLPIESDQHANGDLDTQVGRKRRALRHWRAHELRVWLNQKEMVGMSSDTARRSTCVGEFQTEPDNGAGARIRAKKLKHSGGLMTGRKTQRLKNLCGMNSSGAKTYRRTELQREEQLWFYGAGGALRVRIKTRPDEES